MSNRMPRRSFLLTWLGGLLAGLLGKPRAKAAPISTPLPAEMLPPGVRSASMIDPPPLKRTITTYDANGDVISQREEP